MVADIPIERFATLRAELDVTDEPEAVLRREGWSPESWQAGQEALLVELADEVDRGELARAEAFAEAYRRAKEASLGIQGAPPRAPLCPRPRPSPRLCRL